MSPDAALIADCDELTTLLETANASDVDATAAQMARWEILAERIIAAPTHTADGVIARVRAFAAAHGVTLRGVSRCSLTYRSSRRAGGLGASIPTRSRP